MTLTMSEQAEAPARAVVEQLAGVLEDRMAAYLEHTATAGEWGLGLKCGHVDPRNAQLRHWVAQSASWTLLLVLEGTSAKTIGIRRQLREALAMVEPYDVVGAAVLELARAIRRRHVYNVVRRAAVLMEQLEEPDVAAVLHEYALAHEPAGDGNQFSRIRRRKNEPRR